MSIKKSLLPLLLVLFAFSLKAQRFHAGILLGLTTTQVSGDQLAGFNKTGVVAGGIVSTSLGKNFDLSMELVYIQKGSRRKPKPENDSIYLMKVNYAEVPLLIGYTYKNRIKIEAGPSFGRLLYAYEEDQNGQLPEQDRLPFKDFELSINGGLSYRLYKGLFVHTRIATSVLPIRPYANGQTYYMNRGQYNTVLLFSVKYLFSLEKNKLNE